ncbi:MAG TPA: inositol monophosphatase family protein [Candidatus Dormibacteraeota bacterium]
MRETVLPLAGTEAGRAQLTVGAGGDRTMELDRAAEAVVFGRLEGVADDRETFSVLSEEIGLRSFGADFPLVLVDPVDGSLNAKQGLPFFGLMLTLLDGPTVADTVAGYVLNLVNGEEWKAVRKQGAWRDGQTLQVQPPEDHGRIRLIGLESNPRSLVAAQGLVASSSKVRILGSMALSIAHTAAGAFDAFCAPVPMRVFDMSASLLILAEAGGTATDVHGESLGGLTCNLETRTSLLCSPSAELHAAALKAVRAGK